MGLRDAAQDDYVMVLATIPATRQPRTVPRRNFRKMAAAGRARR